MDFHFLREALEHAKNHKKEREGRSRAVRRADARLKKLNALVPDRKCPVCSDVKLRSRQWVFVSDDRVICKSCFMKGNE